VTSFNPVSLCALKTKKEVGVREGCTLKEQEHPFIFADLA
jgi:hypothetical protein